MATVTAGEGPSSQPADPWLPAPDGDGAITIVFDDTPVFVARATENYQSGLVEYEDLDNVRVVDIRQSIGTDPGTCRLRYIFADEGLGRDPLAPNNFEEALSDLVKKPKTIEPGDRIAVGARRLSDGLLKPLFDGHAVSFEGSLSRDSEGVTILCRGVAARALDVPIGGAVYRDGDLPLVTSDRITEAEPHFNPRGKPNCCPDGETRGETWRHREGMPEDQTYPTFLDPDNTNVGSHAPTYWDLPKAARYICFNHNDEAFVKSPNGAAMDGILVAKVPKTDSMEFDPDNPETYTPFDPLDPSTYTSEPILVADKPIGGKDWPSTLRELVADKGFEVRWHLASGDDLTDDPTRQAGVAETRLEVFASRTGARIGARDLFLQPRGSIIDLGQSNVGGASFARDLSGVVNEWEVRGELVEYEASFVLACGFANVPGLTVFDPYDDKSEGFEGRFNDFRLFIFDETGESHWLPGSDARVITPGDLLGVLGPLVDGVRPWSIRRRPPIGTLFTEAGGDTPPGTKLKHSLAISTDYDGEAADMCPAVWDGTGTWQKVAGGYDLLKDRIGIRINIDQPNEWHIGPSTDAGAPFPDGKVNAIECLSNAAVGQFKKFYLRLTCVVRGDKRVVGLAPRLPQDVLAYTVRRHVDADDRYRKQIIVLGSEHAQDADEDIVARDDTDKAKAEAVALRTATANGILGGSVTIPYLTRHYEIGDRIRSIYGRGLGLRTDGGGETGPPVYPIVTAIRHTFEGGQTTELELSDATIARVPYMAKSTRRHAVPPGARRGR